MTVVVVSKTMRAMRTWEYNTWGKSSALRQLHGLYAHWICGQLTQRRHSGQHWSALVRAHDE